MYKTQRHVPKLWWLNLETELPVFLAITPFIKGVARLKQCVHIAKILLVYFNSQNHCCSIGWPDDAWNQCNSSFGFAKLSTFSWNIPVSAPEFFLFLFFAGGGGGGGGEIFIFLCFHFTLFIYQFIHWFQCVYRCVFCVYWWQALLNVGSKLRIL